MKKYLIILVSLACISATRADDFPLGLFSVSPGNHAPIESVELTQRENRYVLRFRLGGKWEENMVEPMNEGALQAALGTSPSGIHARGLARGPVAFITLYKNATIHGVKISSGILLISPLLGIIELQKTAQQTSVTANVNAPIASSVLPWSQPVKFVDRVTGKFLQFTPDGTVVLWFPRLEDGRSPIMTGRYETTGNGARVTVRLPAASAKTEDLRLESGNLVDVRGNIWTRSD